jgi:hypothetical protein
MAHIVIPAFLVFGLIFGLFTYPHRHLFGEGPPQAPAGDKGGLGARLHWALVATFLWPILVVSGLHGLYRVRAARRT